ncbi:hypothetical protein GGQ80_000051 [Sphingomonas jinjuensis]|uniref:Uncharacterized protein n=1 Tax=Sphingomonas jinjuensis TaxID=535907 RepID=A0A840FFN7_9SPHN|nr:hypothetical protein [Sphingomonas jinjuensis]MBB4152175.1 hypothetical protein [Sphingomonas jinjuensis]
MRRISVSVLTAALLLTACGGGGSEKAGGNEQGSGASGAAASEPVDDQATGDTGNALVPVALPSPTKLSAIPAPFQGRWGLVPNDCDPARADNKGLVTVAANRLSFYESRAVPGSIAQTGPQRITATLAFSGEGQTWTKQAVLAIQDDGRTLVFDQDDPPSSLRYQRCPQQETTP